MNDKRPRIAVTGTSTCIGAAVRDALVDRFDIVVLTRSMAGADARDEPGGRIQRRVCDLFSRSDLESALQGVDYAVYLVHNRSPSARLDQARTRDMDLLVADNFARAAARAGVRQIVYRSPLLSNPAFMPDEAAETSEIVQVLKSHGVPVTVLRTCLIIGSGAELVRMLVRIVTLLPLIPIPKIALTVRRPITLDDLLAAYRYCVGNPGTFGKQFDVFGTETVTLRRMLEETAAALGCRRTFMPAPFLPDWSVALLLRAVFPSVHREFLDYILKALRNNTNGRGNPVERAVAGGSAPFRTSFAACVRAENKGVIERKERRRRERDDEIIRLTSRVRSIQRLTLPDGKHASWVADHYVEWLGRILRPFLSTRTAPDGSWTAIGHPGRIELLSLTFEPLKSSEDRRMYYITGGKLAGLLGRGTARLEFRDMLGGRFTLAAIHDFNPALPWVFYRFTHAVMHYLVMRGYQRHLARLAKNEPVPAEHHH